MTALDLPDALVARERPGEVTYAGGVTVLGDVLVEARGRTFQIPAQLGEARQYAAGLLAAIARVEARNEDTT